MKIEKTIEYTSEYKTKDLAEAAALITKQQKLTGVAREGSLCWFLFENKEICGEVSNQFFFGELLVNAREYHEAITRLKNRIFSKD